MTVQTTRSQDPKMLRRHLNVTAEMRKLIDSFADGLGVPRGLVFAAAVYGFKDQTSQAASRIRTEYTEHARGKRPVGYSASLPEPLTEDLGACYDMLRPVRKAICSAVYLYFFLFTLKTDEDRRKLWDKFALEHMQNARQQHASGG